MPCNQINILHPGMKHFGNEEREILIPLVSFGNFLIPLLCTLVVLSTENLFTCSFGSHRKVKVVIPVNCCQVLSDFVSPVTINRKIAFLDYTSVDT